MSEVGNEHSTTVQVQTQAYSANFDGSNRRTLLVAEGNLNGLNGIAYAEVPSGY